MDNNEQTNDLPKRHVGEIFSLGQSEVDLHTHTVNSDGALTPTQLVAMAAAAGVKHLAVTDHDNVGGVAEATLAAAQYNIEIIPGIEMSADMPSGAEVHILGYYLDVNNEELQAELVRLRKGREGRGYEMVQKLAAMGMPISWQRVQELAAGGSVGRLHIAQAMLEQGYIKTNREAFDNYIADGGPAYVDRAKLSPTESVALIHRAGGVASFAHPIYTADYADVLRELVALGLDGVEAYYGHYKSEDHATLVALADQLGIIATGGSDYHGRPTMEDTPVGGVYVPVESVMRLQAKAETYRKQSA